MHQPFPQPQQPTDLRTHPRVLIVCRRLVRKQKYVNFVGEYHISLLLQNNAVPIIVPRTVPTSNILAAYEPIHGILLIEGEDIADVHKPVSDPLSEECIAHIAKQHPSDTTPDQERDRIEFALVRHALAKNIPILAICRGAQILNVAAGGSLYADVETAVPNAVPHIDYHNYDRHRHGLHIHPETPLHDWFQRKSHISVNSYHHQGIHHLAPRFSSMAHSPDGLCEAFYDKSQYSPSTGRFRVGLQFHPERMQDEQRALQDLPPLYEYPGCTRPYEHFVKAASVFAAKKRRERFLRSRFRTISLARVLRLSLVTPSPASKRMYSNEDVKRIVWSGATVHGANFVFQLLNNTNTSVDSMNDSVHPNLYVDLITEQ
ncbi:Protein NtpR [Gracilariopsis chorda]|uniref:Protein NtpR n=1 Tax=Gracilariopsis chorda TaxID=448386 RepID=A0A2V3IJJ3_9FLOR|nr:Protein NtpR [Gracilariopsis chorda]|eukprot:PXF42264.1 Protein NtpR [Gracilariopsis chorda]